MQKTPSLVIEHRRELGRAGLGMDWSIWETTGFTIFRFHRVEGGYWLILSQHLVGTVQWWCVQSESLNHLDLE